MGSLKNKNDQLKSCQANRAAASVKSGKAGKSSKAKKKKWSKGKMKEKLNNAVLFDQATYGKLLKEVPSYRLIILSVISERLKINGSLACAAINELMAKNLMRQVSAHHTQSIYTRATAS